MIIEEDIAWLKHRLALTSSSLSSSLCSSNPLIYCVIDDIDTNLNQLKETTQVSTIESIPTKEIERLELLKKDIIRQVISTSKRLIQDLCDSIQVERNKFSVENRYMESTSDWQSKVLNAIEILVENVEKENAERGKRRRKMSRGKCRKGK